MLKWYQKTDALFTIAMSAVLLAFWLKGWIPKVATPTNLLLAWILLKLCNIFDHLREHQP